MKFYQGIIVQMQIRAFTEGGNTRRERKEVSH